MAIATGERARVISARLRAVVGWAGAEHDHHRQTPTGNAPGWVSRLRSDWRGGRYRPPEARVGPVESAPKGAHREREVKLEARPELDLPRFDGIAGLRLQSDDELKLDAHYFDTEDLRLTRAGLSLRYRSDDGWTVKVPVGGSSKELDRVEHTIAGDRGAPPEAAKDLVRAWTRSAPLRLVGRLQSRRRRLRLGRGVRSHLEVVDDRVVASVPGAKRSTFREIEVELVDAADKAARKARKLVVSRLRSAGAHRAQNITKIARALGPRALKPPDVTAPVELRRRATVSDAVQAAIGSSLHRLVVNDAGVRLGRDPEAVHQARVATRRLRSDLRTFRPIADRAVTDPLRDELRWLGDKLGAVRDADVLSDLWRGELEVLGTPDREAADALLGLLAHQRDAAHRALQDAMRSPRYDNLLDQLVSTTRRPPVKRKAGKRRAAKVLPKLARRPWRQLQNAVRALPPNPADAQLHEVRKRAKQARYASEAAAAVIGDPAYRFAKGLARLQDVLGAHQDAVVARTWLENARPTGDDRRLSFLAGELAGLASCKRQEHRNAWRSVWRRTRRKRLRKWM